MLHSNRSRGNEQTISHPSVLAWATLFSTQRFEGIYQFVLKCRIANHETYFKDTQEKRTKGFTVCMPWNSTNIYEHEIQPNHFQWVSLDWYILLPSFLRVKKAFVTFVRIELTNGCSSFIYLHFKPAFREWMWLHSLRWAFKMSDVKCYCNDVPSYTRLVIHRNNAI